ncbi:MAG: hypothetical protein WC961_07465 [Anaerovoracaceae bacterium]
MDTLNTEKTEEKGLGSMLGIEDEAPNPEEVSNENATDGGEVTEEVATDNEEAVDSGEGVATEPTTEQPAFFEEINKRFSTELKSEDDFKSLLEASKQVQSYKEKEQTWSAFETEKESLTNKITELESQLNPLSYFSSPEAYKAEQLRKQMPSKDPLILQEIVMQDVNKMDSFEVLVKEKMLSTSGLKKENVEAALMKKYGIDSDTPREEWDDIAKTEIAIDAQAAREKFEELKSKVELPDVKTQEQIKAELDSLKENKIKEIAPYQDKFKSFDKFTRKIGDEQFEFDVPSDYKESLSDMFKGFFVEGNLPVNETNLEIVVELRDALFLLRNFDKIHEVIKKSAVSETVEKTDELLHNKQPQNTATRSDDGEDDRAGLGGRGLEDFLRG